MPEKQNIDKRVGEIAGDVADVKIKAAQLPEIESLDTAKNLASKTTVQEDLLSAGQRRVNLIWEGTQGAIALLITGATIYAVLIGRDSTILGNAFTLIIALYFVRTNHVKIGGVGGTDSR